MIDDKAIRSKKLNAVSLGAGELWFRILLLVDDNGNYFGDPLVVYANAMRNKRGVTAEIAAGFLKELIDIGLLVEYSVSEEEQPYIHVNDFHGHQSFRIDRPVKVEHPIHPGGPYFPETGVVALVERDSNLMDTDGIPDDNRAQPNDSPILEVEVEVKGEVERGNQSSPAPLIPIQNQIAPELVAMQERNRIENERRAAKQARKGKRQIGFGRKEEPRVESKPQRSTAEERGRRAAEASRIFDHPERLPESLRPILPSGGSR